MCINSFNSIVSLMSYKDLYDDIHIKCLLFRAMESIDKDNSIKNLLTPISQKKLNALIKYVRENCTKPITDIKLIVKTKKIVYESMLEQMRHLIAEKAVIYPDVSHIADLIANICTEKFNETYSKTIYDTTYHMGGLLYFTNRYANIPIQITTSIMYFDSVYSISFIGTVQITSCLWKNYFEWVINAELSIMGINYPDIDDVTQYFKNNNL